MRNSWIQDSAALLQFEEFLKPTGELGPGGLGIQNIPSSQISLAYLPFAVLLIQVENWG